MESWRTRAIQALAEALARLAKRKDALSYDIPLAAHLVSPRKRKGLPYTHHGIYIGDGRVIHYSGYHDAMETGPVAETTLYAFAHGSPVHVLMYPKGVVQFTEEEIITRARSRMGENKYDLLKNNCEHFAEWCCTGINAAYQNKRWWSQVRLASEIVVTRTGSFLMRKHGRKVIRRYLPEKYVAWSLIAVETLSLGMTFLRLRKQIIEDRERHFRIGPPLIVHKDQTVVRRDPV
jgi:hypothetical protein